MQYNNNVLLNCFTIKQLYSNKQLYNCLSSNTQTIIKLYKHYNCTLQQLYYIQAYNTNCISKTIANIKAYKQIINNI